MKTLDALFRLENLEAPLALIRAFAPAMQTKG